MSRIALCLVAALLFAAAAQADPIPEGPGEIALEAGGVRLTAHTYKPSGYTNGALLVVLHGLGRNARGYRDYARSLSDRYGFLVVAPLFDRARFPTWRYQAGGIARRRGDAAMHVEGESAWIGTVLQDVVTAVRRIENAPALPYAFAGHSAGAQALSRYAAFTSSEATRVVLANPSTYLWPTRDIDFPYGLGGLPQEIADDALLRRYLAAPLVVLLGTDDVKRDVDLNVKRGAMMQGANRYERGIAFFAAGERIARERGWSFGWELVEVPGVGHSARRMLGSPEAAAVFAR